MADLDSKKYYWLKLKKDFFKQHQIKVLKSLPNGRLYALIYLELLAESTSHEGKLRYSDMIPYDLNILGSVIDEDIDNLKCAIDVLEKLELVTIQDDKTIYMNEINKLIGSETHGAERMRNWRENKENSELLHCNKMSQNCNREYRVKSKENRVKSIDIKRGVFTPPTLEEVMAYCAERNNGIDSEQFINFYASKGWMVGKNKMKDWKAAVRTWEKRNNDDLDRKYKEARIKEIEQKTKSNLQKIAEISNKTDNTKNLRALIRGEYDERTGECIDCSNKSLLPDKKDTG